MDIRTARRNNFMHWLVMGAILTLTLQITFQSPVGLWEADIDTDDRPDPMTARVDDAVEDGTDDATARRDRTVNEQDAQPSQTSQLASEREKRRDAQTPLKCHRGPYGVAPTHTSNNAPCDPSQPTVSTQRERNTRSRSRAESELIEDKWKLSNFYTLKDVFLFSFFDETTINLSDSEHNQLQSVEMSEGDYKYISLTSGTYYTNGTEKFSILTGDPVQDGVAGYYVLDENGFGSFTNAYTFLPVSQFPGRERTIIFAYEDDTRVTVTRMDNDAVLYSGVLQAGEHHTATDWHSIHININSTKAVSTLVYFDSGYYVPATTGLFTGTEFYTYVGTVGGWNQDLNLIAYEDNTQITVENAESGATIWGGSLMAGGHHAISTANQEVYYHITSSKNITVSNLPYASYSTSYYHGTYVADRTGSGIGTEIISTAMDGSAAYLYVFAYFDDTHFTVYDAASGALVSEHTLNRGEAINVNPGHGLWKIVSDEKPISAMEGFATFGASFAWPLFGGARPDFRIIPRIYPDGREESLTKKLLPGQSAQFNLTVVNRYERDEDIVVDLNVNGVPENWSASLDVQNVTLGQNGWQDITLTVTAPENLAQRSEQIMINVSGVLRSDHNVTHQLAVFPIVEASLDFLVKYSVEEDFVTQKKEATIAAGEEQPFSVGLTNLGYLNDTYHLRFEGLLPGWDAAFPNGRANMSFALPSKYYAPDNTMLIPITVTAPGGAYEGTTLLLELVAVSDRAPALINEELERKDELYLSVTGAAALELSPDENEKMVPPGGTAQYELRVLNNGNADLMVTLSFEGGAEPGIPDETSDDWFASFGQSSFTIRTRASTTILFYVHAPADARAFTQLVLEVRARGHLVGDPSQHTSAPPLQLVTTASRIHRLAFSSIEDEVETMPGTTASFAIEIENRGNGEETIYPALDKMDAGWNYSVSFEGHPINSINLLPWSTATINFSFGVPPDALVGSQEVVVNLTGEAGIDEDGDGVADEDPIDGVDNDEDGLVDEDPPNTLSFTVLIKQRFETALKATTTTRRTEPGRRAQFSIEVVNNGNGPDTVDLRFASLPSTGTGGWDSYFASVASSRTPVTREQTAFDDPIELDAYFIEGDPLEHIELVPAGLSNFDEIEVRLAPGQDAIVRIGILTPRNAAAGIYNSTVEARSLGPERDMSDNRVEFSIELRNPDLRFVDRNGNNEADDITFTGTLEDGELVSVMVEFENIGEIHAQDIVVQLLVDGEPVKSKEFGKVTNIKGENTKTVTFNWRAKAGEHELKVEIDPDNTIAELREDDNMVARTIEVGGGGLFQPGFGASSLISALVCAVVVVILLMGRRERRR